jgi:hypothetical protein
MINPNDFLSSSKSLEVGEEIEEIGGSYSCPEQGCYEVTNDALFNPNTRVLTWTCINGHNGKANI